MATFPAPLRAGDLVAVVAPSSPLPQDDFWRGMAWLRARYRVRMTPAVLSRAGYLAGDDERRASELERALAWPDVRAVVAGRGGYGAMRLLERHPLRRLSEEPRWLVGFSDLTALHIEAASAGVASVHGPNVTGLGRTSPANRAAWLAALERPRDAVTWRGLEVLHIGRTSTARGAAAGGNLALVSAMAATGRDVCPAGSVLFLEDVDERPYRVDRMLTSLRLGGQLGRAAAIVLGGFTRCAPGVDGTRVETVLAELTRGLGIAVLAGAPFGHGDDNRAFVLGSEVLVTSSGEVTFSPD